MTYAGHIEHGVVALDGPQRPTEGTIVRVVEEATEPGVGAALDLLAGQARRLPADLA